MTSRRKVIQSIGLATMAWPMLSTESNAGTPPMPVADDKEYWKKIRDQFSLARDKVFFNPGTVGAMPKVVVDKMIAHLQYIATDVADWAYKDDNKEEFISGYNNLMGIRTKVAKLINADAGEIAMTDNVTNGMSYIANGITLQPGDEVITTDQEHSGGQSGFMLKAKRYGTIFR
ncbi:MAG: aminotransferase class V-fold PLP-dependent enzyme, partial [Bacteroidetes bacterium]|nr:aminotransferase class V-fold PLP-dependent enzyme [Bacteroidota bacterium]